MYLYLSCLGGLCPGCRFSDLSGDMILRVCGVSELFERLSLCLCSLHTELGGVCMPQESVSGCEAWAVLFPGMRTLVCWGGAVSLGVVPAPFGSLGLTQAVRSLHRESVAGCVW